MNRSLNFCDFSIGDARVARLGTRATKRHPTNSVEGIATSVVLRAANQNIVIAGGNHSIMQCELVRNDMLI